MNLEINVYDNSKFVSIEIKNQTGDTKKINLPKNIMKHTTCFNATLKHLLESHVKTNDKMKSLSKRKITSKLGKGNQYTIEKEEYKNAFSDRDIDRVAVWIVDSFVKSKYKGRIDAYVGPSEFE